MIRAFLLAPLTAPTAYATVLFVVAAIQGVFGARPIPSLRAAFTLLAFVAMVGVPIAYAATVVGGVLVYWLLRRAGALSRWSVLITGISIGIVVSRLPARQLRGDLFSIPFPWWAGALLGLAAADVFWRLLPQDSRR